MYLFASASLHCKLYNCRYICNSCLLFVHWFPIPQCNVNDPQFVFYQMVLQVQGGKRRVKDGGGASPPPPPDPPMIYTVKKIYSHNFHYSKQLVAFMHYLKTVNIVADISSDFHYIQQQSLFCFIVCLVPITILYCCR